MKTKKLSICNCTIIILSLITINISISSCQKDTTLETDITRYSWELLSVKEEGNTYKKPSADVFNPNAYILQFSSDTIFLLNTSINVAGGEYNISSKGSISILNYQPLSEICCETAFDEKLLSVFPTITSYSVKGSKLIFKTNGNEVEFKKK